MTVTVWTEKYRPKTLDGIVGHQDLIKELKAYVRDNFLPHLLFYGEKAGTGKTSTALALRNELGWAMAKLNGSDERRLSDFRTKIKDALKNRSFVGKKIVFIDEAGELTVNFQRALKEPMRVYSKNASVILITNHISRINPRIKDRCYMYHFDPLPIEKITERLRYITTQEDLDRSIGELTRYAEEADGSVRKAIQLLRRSRFSARSQEKETIRV